MNESLRGGDEDREAEAGETALPDIAFDPEPATIAIVIPLPLVPRNGHGSLCTPAAIRLVDPRGGGGLMPIAVPVIAPGRPVIRR